MFFIFIAADSLARQPTDKTILSDFEEHDYLYDADAFLFQGSAYQRFDGNQRHKHSEHQRQSYQRQQYDMERGCMDYLTWVCCFLCIVSTMLLSTLDFRPVAIVVFVFVSSILSCLYRSSLYHWYVCISDLWHNINAVVFIIKRLSSHVIQVWLVLLVILMRKRRVATENRQKNSVIMLLLFSMYIIESVILNQLNV